MKPHPKLRRFALWGGAVATVLLAAMWVVSSRWLCIVQLPSWCADVAEGGVRLWNRYDRLLPEDYGWRVVDYSSVTKEASVAFAWGLRPPRLTLGPVWHVSLPFWLPVTIALAVTLTAWRFTILARRRERLGLCPKCNYNRTGLAPAAVCPECGAQPAAKTSA